jgi:hypothetical protein
MSVDPSPGKLRFNPNAPALFLFTGNGVSYARRGSFIDTTNQSSDTRLCRKINWVDNTTSRSQSSA